MAKNNSDTVMEQDKPEVETVSAEGVVEVTPTVSQPVESEVVEQHDHQTLPSEGARARRAFMMKNLLPNPDFINKEVVSKGKGAKAAVGRIWGYANGYERKANEFQGRILESIAIKGVFQSESAVTGEISEFTTVFLPMAYAEKLAGVFDMDKSIRMIEVDCDIGVEATGKTIPYEWVCIAFREGEEMQPLRKLRSSRVVGASAWANNQLTGSSQAAIEDKSNA